MKLGRTASYFPHLFYDFITATSGQITQQQTFVISADCLFKTPRCNGEELFISILCVRRKDTTGLEEILEEIYVSVLQCMCFWLGP